jgi:PAS domain S-box-containing protein
MISLTTGCGIAVLITCVLLYSRDVDDAINIRLNSASNIVAYEIAEAKERTTLTASSMARNLDLIDALSSYDRDNSDRSENGSEQVAYIAYRLKEAAQLDFCVVIDNAGHVIARTHDPESFGDRSLHLPNVAAAFGGETDANFSYGISPIIQLAISASAPVYDNDMNIIGVITLGFRLDDQHFVDKLYTLTGCEITIFLDDERIATTIESEDDSYAVGTKASEHISRTVLAGGTYRGSSGLFGREVFSVYSPLQDRSGKAIGMIAIAYYTAEAINRMIFSVVAGMVITLIVLAICFVISKFISRRIIRQLEHTHMLFEATPLSCILWDKDYQVIDCNDGAVKILELNSKQELKERIGELMPLAQPCGTPTDELLNFHFKKAADEGCSVFEFWHKLASGEMLPLAATLVKIDSDDTGAYYASYSRDLREHKRMMKSIKEADERALLMLDTIPVCIAVWDKNYTLIECNRASVEFFGLNDKQEYFDRFYEFSPEFQPDGASSGEKSKELLDKALTEGTSSYEWTHLFNGEIIPCELIINRVKYNDDYVAVVCMRDLREQKAYLAEIELQNSLLTTLFDSAPDIIFAKDTELRFTHFNKAFMKHFDCDESAIGKNDAECLGIPLELAKRFNELDRSVINDRIINVTEEYVPGADGRMPFFETIKVPFMLDNKPIGVLGIARDITKRKEMEEAALEASRSKSAFLANMSHEIRTPMNSIIGFSELALDGNNPPKTTDYLKKITQNSEWLLQIINDILDISKIESGKFELENIPFDLCELFKSCRTLIMPKADEKGLVMHFYAEPSVGKKICGDPTRLRQVLVNLLSNAVKFTNSGMIKMLAVITNATEDKATMLFEVKDSGIGMTPEQIKTICDPFTQADSSVTRKFGGTGLGLAISRNFIELMGGSIKVESTIGLGSKFSFELTFDLIDDDKAVFMPKQTVFNESEKPLFSGEVLVCEDNALNQQVIREHLLRVGLNVVVANDGKEGVDFVKGKLDEGKQPFDLIFMDMHMPVMDGLEAMTRIIEMGVKTPIVALTANIMSDALELYQASGISDTVGKPFTAKELWKCLIKYFKNENTSSLSDSLPVRSISKNNDDDIGIEEMQRIFVKENQDTFVNITKALESDDAKTAYRLVHSLKSNAGYIKERRLQETCATLETLLSRKTNPTDSIGEHVDIIRAELEEILKKLAYLLTETSVASKLDAADADRITELFEKLEPALKSKNTHSLDFIGALRAIPGLNELADLIEQCKFKQALSVLEAIRGELGNG